MFSSTARISGLSGSGFDTEGTIEKLMQVQRAKYDKMFQKKEALTWKKEVYREMNTAIAKMRDTAFNMKLQSSFMAKSAFSRDESKVTASASSSATDGTSQIRIDQLAEGVSKMSQGTITVSGGTVSSLKSQFFAAGSAEETAFNALADTATALAFKINGHEFSYTKAQVTSKTVYNVLYDINMANLGVKASYDASLDFAFLSTSGTGAGNALELKDLASVGGIKFLEDKLQLGTEFNVLANQTSMSSGTKISESGTSSSNTLDKQLGITSSIAGNFRISLDGGSAYTDIAFNSATSSLDDLITSINKNSALKSHVKADYDKTTDRFLLVSLDASNIAVDAVGVSGQLAAQLNLQESFLYHGQDAKIYINNMDTAGDPITKSSNSFSINGVTYNLKDTTAGAFVKVDVSTDVDAVFDKIKTFIDDYNSTIDTIYKEMTEKAYRDYQPLTDQQKEEMTEDEIKKWEEKAKSGLLHNDSILQNLYQTMRSQIALSVHGVPSDSQLTSIGIVTGSYTEHGKLQFSDYTGDTLKETLRNDPDNIIKLFTQTDSGSLSKNSSSTITTGAGNSSTLLSQQFVALSGEVRFSIQGKTFKFDTASDTLDEVINSINTILAGKVSVSYSGDKITMTSLNSQPLELTNINGHFLSNQLKLDMTTSEANQGIGRRLYDALTRSLNSIADAAGYTTNTDDQSYLGKIITELENRMDAEYNRLIDKEDAYWSKFTAMEKALEQMYSQSMWLTQQLSSA